MSTRSIRRMFGQLPPSEKPSDGEHPALHYLPGLAPSCSEPDEIIHPPNTSPSSGWWVRRSVKQVTDAAGQPLGFRHQLMHGRKVVRTGIGADYARTFRQQADFLNSMDKRAQQRVVTTVDAHFVTTSPA